jgi:hypothetical protein
MASKSKKLKASFEKVPDLDDFFLKSFRKLHAVSDFLMYHRENGNLASALEDSSQHRTLIKKLRVAVRDTVLGTNHFLDAILEPAPDKWDSLWTRVNWCDRPERIYGATLDRTLRNQKIILPCPYYSDYYYALDMLRKKGSWQNGPRRPQIIAMLSWMDMLMGHFLHLCNSCTEEWFDSEEATASVDYWARIRFTKPPKARKQVPVVPRRSSSSDDVTGSNERLAALSSPL